MNDIAIETRFKYWARMGYASRGVIYLVIGGLAIMAALGMGGATTDARGAILAIMNRPFGRVLLGLLVVGLVGYSIWRTIQTFRDPDDHGTSLKGLAIRFGLFASALTHLALAWFAISLLFAEVSSGGSGSVDQPTWINQTTAQLILGVVGVGFIIVGLAHAYKGWTARFERYMYIPQPHNSWARPLCRFGLIARGVVWGIVGWFLIDSALRANTGQIRGLGDALASLQDEPFGPWLLGGVATGLFAFGVYSMLEAIYRRIDTGD